MAWRVLEFIQSPYISPLYKVLANANQLNKQKLTNEYQYHRKIEIQSTFRIRRFGYLTGMSCKLKDIAEAFAITGAIRLFYFVDSEYFTNSADIFCSATFVTASFVTDILHIIILLIKTHAIFVKKQDTA